VSSKGRREGAVAFLAVQMEHGNELDCRRFLGSTIQESEMTYRWPLPHPDPVLDEALVIALNYLEAMGQAKAEDDTRRVVAGYVLAAWLQGTRHKLRLANVGIVAAQQARASGKRLGNLRLDVISDLTLP
jgi:hypothetical protein